jgi:hypothetical protein
MSSESNTWPMLTSALDAWVPSLTPRAMAMWLCSSMMPDVTCLPEASMTCKPAATWAPKSAVGLSRLPTATIFPWWIKTSA